MATLQALMPYLEKKYVIQNVRGESLHLVDSWVEWRHHSHWGSGFEAEKVSLSRVASIEDIWDYGVLFQQGKNLFVETDLAKIEQLIARGTQGGSV